MHDDRSLSSILSLSLGSGWCDQRESHCLAIALSTNVNTHLCREKLDDRVSYTRSVRRTTDLNFVGIVFSFSRFSGTFEIDEISQRPNKQQRFLKGHHYLSRSFLRGHLWSMCSTHTETFDLLLIRNNKTRFYCLSLTKDSMRRDLCRDKLTMLTNTHTRFVPLIFFSFTYGKAEWQSNFHTGEKDN